MIDYYVKQINSGVAYKFTCAYHYSGIGFKKARLNLGFFRKTDNLLVGVQQWGISAAENIRLDRYVKEPISNKEYLELNRFCMAESEPKNAESKAIGLGIRWIKKNMPEIRLLVSYAGRIEGNYGYIYQATNWEYLGYFVSPGFWIIDGKEKHQITLQIWKQRNYPTYGLVDALCKEYNTVKNYKSKQFIYIQRLDKTLTPSEPIKPYPKLRTDAPIQLDMTIYKDEPFAITTTIQLDPQYYYNEKDLLFSRRTMIKNKKIIPDIVIYAMYNREGKLELTVNNLNDFESWGYKKQRVKRAIENKVSYENSIFIMYINKTPDSEITFDNYVCKIDGKYFFRNSEIMDYLGTTRQNISFARQHKAKTINGHSIDWKED